MLSMFVLSCVSQLVESMRHSVDFISDGSPDDTKTACGRFAGCELSKNGLRLFVRTEAGRLRRINWRMRQTEAESIRDAMAGLWIDEVDSQDSQEKKAVLRTVGYPSTGKPAVYAVVCADSRNVRLSAA